MKAGSNACRPCTQRDAQEAIKPPQRRNRLRHPVLLLLVDEPTLILSLAHKRWAQNEAEKIVLDGDLMSASLPCTASGTTEADT
ncbi:DUF4391 domain-containing protein [Comamonas aquatica]|nr:DUF4391 domain-containing protein [Comamonas aquatica]MDH1447262.1 DUF4391 domain-containing protein [Comamonas aquatica]